MTLDTHPYRAWMLAYSNLHGLAVPPRARIGAHGQLNTIEREWLTRIQRHMNALNVKAVKAGKRQPFKGVTTTGVLDEWTREALSPDRPNWQVEFARIARQDCANPNAAYYTQGAARWQGVRAIYGKVTPTKSIPRLRSGDCSAGYTRWVLWGLQQQLGHVPHDVVNDARWQAGYTGTIRATCRRVDTPQVGDAVLYGAGVGHHVVGVLDPHSKECASHGSNAGPNIVHWDYRNDFAGFYRPLINLA